jgi:hypothetical protein
LEYIISAVEDPFDIGEDSGHRVGDRVDVFTESKFFAFQSVIELSGGMKARRLKVENDLASEERAGGGPRGLERRSSRHLLVALV